jgi:hypothetical protein
MMGIATQTAWQTDTPKQMMERILDGYRWMALIKESLNKMREEQNEVWVPCDMSLGCRILHVYLC